MPNEGSHPQQKPAYHVRWPKSECEDPAGGVILQFCNVCDGGAKAQSYILPKTLVLLAMMSMRALAKTRGSPQGTCLSSAAMESGTGSWGGGSSSAVTPDIAPVVASMMQGHVGSSDRRPGKLLFAAHHTGHAVSCHCTGTDLPPLHDVGRRKGSDMVLCGVTTRKVLLCAPGSVY